MALGASFDEVQLMFKMQEEADSVDEADVSELST